MMSPPQPGAVVQRTALAALTATAANVTIFLVAQRLGMVTDVPIAQLQNAPMSWWAVAGATFSSVVGGGLVYLLLSRFTRHPVRIFTWTALVVLLLSNVAPLTLDAPPGMRLTLVVLHVLATVVTLRLLITGHRPQ